jgi:hypothetical protein
LLCGGAAACTSLIDLDAAPLPDAGSTDASVESSDAKSGGEGAAPAYDGGAPDVVDAGANGGSLPGEIVASTSPLVLEGITGDDWLLYEDPGTGFYAIALTGGAPLRLLPPLASDFESFDVTVQGRVALINRVQSDGLSVLTVWTSLTGAHAIANGSNGTVSADGTRFLYLAPLLVDGSASGMLELVESDVDLSHATTLWTSSYPIFDLAVSPDRFVVQLPFEDDAGMMDIRVDSYSNLGADILLFGHPRYRLSVAADLAWSFDESGGPLLMRTVDGGPVVSLDLPTSTPMKSATATPDGTRIVIIDAAGGLWLTPTTQAAPQPLAAGDAGIDAGAPVSMAPDDAHFLFTNAAGGIMIAATASGHPVPVRSVAGGSPSGLRFTRDSRYVVFTEGLELEAAPLDTGVAVPIASNVDCETHSGCWAIAHDGKVVYVMNGDLWEVDTADIASPALVARSIVQFLLDPTGTSGAYRFRDSASVDHSGLYAFSVP